MMETRELTAACGGQPGVWQMARRVKVVLPDVPEDIAMSHLALTYPDGMAVRCRRGPKGGYLNITYWTQLDRDRRLMPRTRPGWQWYIVVGVVHDDDD